MSYTESVTRCQQARALDIVRAVKHIHTLKKVLAYVHSDIDLQFHILYENASRLTRKYDVEVKTRICSRQARANHPNSTTKEYYRRSLVIPFLDHLESQIDTRFTDHSLTAMRCLGIIPACFSDDGIASDVEMIEFFKDDLTFPSSVKAELDLWRSYISESNCDLPDTPKAAFEHANPLVFHNVRRMLAHVMVLPVFS